jgi:ribosomal-protein-alanine N-acetyltransferase
MILETNRLILREFTTDDAAFIYQLVNTPEWINNIGDKQVHNLNDAQNYLLNGPIKSYAENGFGLWAIVLKDGGTPIGMCGIIKRDTLDHCDIGYALLPQYTGKGYAFEAASATLKYGFGNLQLDKIVAITTQTNALSINLLRKLELRFSQILASPAIMKNLCCLK